VIIRRFISAAGATVIRGLIGQHSNDLDSNLPMAITAPPRSLKTWQDAARVRRNISVIWWYKSLPRRYDNG
jgi:hypothetical protein